MSRCFCSLKKIFAITYTKSVSSLSCTTGWKTRALRRIPSRQQESSLLANTRPAGERDTKASKEETGVSLADFFLRDMQAVRKVPFRLWAAAEEDSDGDCGGFRSKKKPKKTTNVKIRKRRQAAQRLEPDKSYKATWSATDTMKGRSKEKKNYVRMMNCGHGWTQCGFLHKCGVDRGSGKKKNRQTLNWWSWSQREKKWNKNLPSSYVIHAYRK